MATSQMNEVIHHLCRTMLLREGAGLTDGQLLGRFIEHEDETAFASLVGRHGPMVWGVCCRLLNHHDAEDAFQATFLVLVRKAASIVPRERVANWHYGVAHQTALQARRNATRRKAREKQVTEMPEPVVAAQDIWRDLQPLLDQELSRLPDTYREVIVVCDLEGKTRKEAAQQLGLPEGTIGSRLARARTMLAKRLARHGLSLSGGLLTAVLSQKMASASVPSSVVSSTIKAASTFAAGQATGLISIKVAALTEGVLKAMLFTKLKVIAVVLIFGFLATGATILSSRTAAGQDDKQPTAEKPVEPAATPEKEKEAFTAWGEEINGLQAGLGFRPGEHRAYHHGETVTLVVRVRNVGKETVKFQYLNGVFFDKPPTVTDGEGKPIASVGLSRSGVHSPRDVSMAPGKTIELYEWKPVIKAPSEKEPLAPVAPGWLSATGKLSVQYERVLENSSWGSIKIDPALSKLATGKLELEIKSDPPKKQVQKQQKEGFTAWGEEVNGLQAGLGFRPGEQGVRHDCGMVTLVVRVRNVSMKEAGFQ